MLDRLLKTNGRRLNMEVYWKRREVEGKASLKSKEAAV